MGFTTFPPYTNGSDCGKEGPLNIPAQIYLRTYILKNILSQLKTIRIWTQMFFNECVAAKMYSTENGNQCDKNVSVCLFILLIESVLSVL